MPDAKFDKKHRLEGFNYSSQGSYMVTFATAKRNPILSDVFTTTGDPRDAQTKNTEIGEILENYIHQIPSHYQNVSVDAYVIMPDHVHILLSFGDDQPQEAFEYSRLSKIVHALKRMVTKSLGYSIWQADYYDNIAFSDKSYDAFQWYIADNPIVWLLKHEEPSLSDNGKITSNGE